MEMYAFELGRQKELCFSELQSVLGKNNLVERNIDTAIFRLKNQNPQKLQDMLGGTIKIIEIFDEVKAEDKNTIHRKTEESFERFLKKDFMGASGKIPFSVSVLSFLNLREIDIKRLLTSSKKVIKSMGLNARFVNKNFKNTKPSTIFKAKVLEKGIDLNVIKGKTKIFLGKTIAIQNINAYTKRDFDKPGRDARVGMLPPKLAQIMINLAGKTQTIYDPFCGTGTILMEGLLMGKKVIGSDMDKRMTEYSRKNCDWLIKEFLSHQKNNSTIPSSHQKTGTSSTKQSTQQKNSAIPSFPQIFTADARFLTKKNLPFSPDAIITEGYLGTPLTKFPSPEEAEKIFRELANLHINWLRAVRKISDAKIIMCTAALQHGKKTLHLPRFEEIAKMAGYKIAQSFTYSRPDQIVARDIHLLLP